MSGTGWTGGSTRRWRRIRAAVLDRDGHQCRTHAEGWCAALPRHVCTVTATQVHHLDGKVHGDDPQRLRASCATCNRLIGDPQANKVDPLPQPRTAW